MTASTLADRFVEALSELEKDRNVSPLAALFANEAEVGNVIAPEQFHGPDGAREFWTKYRETFEAMQSDFRNRIVSDGRVALEWTTDATSVNGQSVRYEGVSILEVAGDQITRFRAYFDPSALGRQIEANAARR